MKKFKVCFEVAENRLPLIIELLSGEVKSLNINDVGGTGFTRHRKTKPVSETDLGRLAIGLFKGKDVVSAERIQKIFKENGYKPQSASSTLFSLVKEGLLTRPMRGFYELTPKLNSD